MSDAAARGDGHGDLTLLGRSIPSKVFDLLREKVEAEGHEGPKLETVAARPGLAVASATIEVLVSWCPVTHQIDYYLPVEITYAPRERLVESKSLKLYGEWFLTRAMFAEVLAVQIAEDVRDATDASWVQVKVYQAVRGGIRLAGEARLPVQATAGEAETAAAAGAGRPAERPDSA